MVFNELESFILIDIYFIFLPDEMVEHVLTMSFGTLASYNKQNALH